MRSALIVLFLVALPLSPAGARSSLDADTLAGLAFRQHPGASLPLETTLSDEDGHPVRLGEYFGRRPVVLVLDYLRCRTLCGVVLGNLAAALDPLPLDAGRDFEVVAVSIDPRDTSADAAAAKARDLARYHHAGAAAGWHFLVGGEAAVRPLADAVGFPYRYDAAIDQYAHPAGLTVVSPAGSIARYILGVDYRPIDLRLAITEAARGKVSAPLSRLLLLCYGYDPQQGRYTPQIEGAMILVNLAGVLGFVAIIAAIHRRRRE
jgi:protein SCO1/2